MSNHELSEALRASNLAQKLVELLHTEPPEIQQKAINAARLMLGTQDNSTKPELPADATSLDMASFFTRGEKLKPHELAHLCAAYHFAQYGMSAFSLEDLRAIARDAGVVLPDRLDMTISGAAKEGKKLFQSVAKGSFKPTAAGAAAFNERWQVKPGRNQKSST